MPVRREGSVISEIRRSVCGACIARRVRKLPSPGGILIGDVRNVVAANPRKIPSARCPPAYHEGHRYPGRRSSRASLHERGLTEYPQLAITTSGYASAAPNLRNEFIAPQVKKDAIPK